MSEPTTQAGKRLLDELAESPLPGARYAYDVVSRRILAIEAEARDEALMAASDQTAELIQHERQRFAARIEERVAGLPHLLPEAWLSHPDSEWLLPISAVLDAIREEADR